MKVGPCRCSSRCELERNEAMRQRTTYNRLGGKIMFDKRVIEQYANECQRNCPPTPVRTHLYFQLEDCRGRRSRVVNGTRSSKSSSWIFKWLVDRLLGYKGTNESRSSRCIATITVEWSVVRSTEGSAFNYSRSSRDEEMQERG